MSGDHTVNGQARLVANLRIVAATADERLALRGQRSVLDRIPYPRPRLQGRGRQKPPFADGLLGVRDTAPDADAALGRAAQIPRIRVHDGGMSGNNCHTRIVVCKADSMTFSEGMQIDTSTTSSSGGGRGPGRGMAIGGGFGGLLIVVVALLLGVNPGSVIPQRQGPYADQGSRPRGST